MSTGERGFLPQLLQMISQTLSSDNATRQQAEKSLEEATKQSPDNFLLGLTEIVGSSEVPEAERLSALIMLRRAVAFNKMKDTTWKFVQPATKDEIKARTLRLLMQDNPPRSLKPHISDLAGNLATSVITEAGQWPQLTSLLGQWTTSPSEEQREMALKVFTFLIRSRVSMDGFFDSLQSVYAQAFQDASARVRVAALEGSIDLVYAHRPFLEDLQKAIPHAFETVTGCLNAGQEEMTTTTLEHLIGLLELCPEVIEQCVDAVLDCCLSIASQRSVPESVRFLCVELVITLGENKPTYLRKREAFLPKFIALLLTMMAQIEDNDDWNLGEQYDNEEEEREIGNYSLDRLALSVRLPVVQVLFEDSFLPRMLQNNEWRMRHTALIAISLVGEGCADAIKQNLERVVQMILPSFQDAHERVRWAACNTIGQMATDFHPVLQKKFHQPLLTALIHVMDDQANPRVQSYAAAAIINFCEDIKPKIVLPYVEPLLAKLLALIRTPAEIVIEQGITAAAAVADCVGTAFIPYYHDFMPLMQAYLTGAGPVDSLKLRAKSIEAIGLVAAAVGLEVFRPHAQAIMTLLLELEGANLPPDDPRKPLLQRAWGRFSKALKHEFAPYLGPILPGVLRSAGLKAEVKLLSADESEDENWQLLQIDTQNTIGVNTAVIQEKAAAMTLLFWLTFELKEQFYPYVRQIAPLCIEGLAFFYNESVRSAASSILPCLLRATCECAGQQNPEVQAFAREVILALLKAVDQEVYAEVTLTFLDNLQECVEAAGENGLSQVELSAMIQTLEKLMGEFQEQRGPHMREMQEDEDRADRAREELEKQHEIVIKIAELAGKTLEMHGRHFLPYLTNVNQFFGSLLNMNDFDQEIQISACYFDDLVEFGTLEAQSIYQGWLGRVVSLMLHPDTDVRQAVVYGLGVLAEKNPELFASVRGEVMSQLQQLITQEDAREEENAHVTENAISALGKIIQFHAQAIPVGAILPVWLSYLPVSEDDETTVIYKQLCHFVVQYPALVLGDNQERLGMVLALLVDALGTSLVEDETNEVIVSIIKNLQSQWGDKMQAAFHSLPPPLQEKAQQIV